MAETLSNIFHITEVQYIEGRGQSLVSVRGWFDWKKKGGDALFALLDQEKPEVLESYEEGIEIRLKYLQIRAAMDREYCFKVELPKDFKKHKTLSVWQREGEKQVRLLKIKVKGLSGADIPFDRRAQKARELWYSRGVRGFTEKFLARLGKQTRIDYMDFRKRMTGFCGGSASENIRFLVLTYEESASKNERLKKSLDRQNYSNFMVIPFAESGRWRGELSKDVLVALLPESMELEPDCLGRAAQACRENKGADFIYGDNDVLSGDGTYKNPDFKPGPSEDLLRSRNYIGSFLAVGTDVFLRAVETRKGGFTKSDIYDYVLRCWESAGQKYHIPQVLYHIPAAKRSETEAKAEIKALNGYHLRNRTGAAVEKTGMAGIYHTVYPAAGHPLISVIIPNKDHREDLQKCLDSILRKSTYSNFEILIAENNSAEEETFSFYREMEKRDSRVRVLYWKKEFNYSAINNFAAGEAKGEYYLFLNNDTEVISGSWLEEMVMHCAREEVGAVGAQLLYSDGTVQHAGVIMGMGGLAGHAFGGCPASLPAYQEWKYAVRDLSAVTAACMMVKKEVFHQLNGFCEELAVAFNDVDLCLRIRDLGKLVVYNPFVKLYHHESKSRGMEDTEKKVRRFHREVILLAGRHPWIMEKTDPYYNPNLTVDRSDFSLNERAVPSCEEVM